MICTIIIFKELSQYAKIFLNTIHAFTQKLAYAIHTIIDPILILRKTRHGKRGRASHLRSYFGRNETRLQTLWRLDHLSSFSSARLRTHDIRITGPRHGTFAGLFLGPRVTSYSPKKSYESLSFRRGAPGAPGSFSWIDTCKAAMGGCFN